MARAALLALSALSASPAAGAPPTAATRAALVKEAFGTMPTKARPDFVFDVSRQRAGATGGATAGIGPNTTALVWTIRDGGLELNATVFYSLSAPLLPLCCPRPPPHPWPGCSGGALGVGR